MSHFNVACLLIASIVAGSAIAQTGLSSPGHNAAARSLADVMKERPFVDAEKSYRGWIIEKSADFGVTLLEVVGTIPLHMHPDGNRRMFLLEGEMKMLGGEHEMDMKPGDYMYLPRDHHHKVWLSPNSKRALFLLVDNPPVSTGNVVWLEPKPKLTMNPDQARSALSVEHRCVAGPEKKPSK